MIDCSKDIVAYHNEMVRLSGIDRDAMRARRLSNRDRLRKGLKLNKMPNLREIKTQGSFDMRTMVQHDSNHYDIDDGVYFDIKNLKKGSNGPCMSPKQVRKMVCEAIFDKKFIKECTVREKCVRVRYKKGCHIDMPVYRCIRKRSENGLDYIYELAIGGKWRRSDARHVATWFKKMNLELSPSLSNGGQMRRIVRQIKKFSKKQDDWSEKILGGFGITALTVECYRADASREDKALYNTIIAIRDRLKRNLSIEHPVTYGTYIDGGQNDAKVKFLLKKITVAINNLEPLHKSDCTRLDALECWNKFFSTDFFGKR